MREFIVDHMGLNIGEIQRSSLGQALVRFRNIFDRDNLIALSPMQYLIHCSLLLGIIGPRIGGI